MHPLNVGSLVRVENGRVEVLITSRDLDLRHEDRTYRVGQLGSYVTVPLHDRTLVGFVTGTERREAPGDNVDPQLLMRVQLLGEISSGRFLRGVNEYPIIGDPVHLATDEDFEVIFGGSDKLSAGSQLRSSFSLGRFAYNTNFEVKVRGSQFFARHAALLGNSGSGKSCTAARILQEVVALEESQVVLFDMHGEYRSAFCNDEGRLNSNVTYLDVDDLILPYWLLKYEELEALFIDRSNPLNITTQISFLRTALMEFKKDAATELGLTRLLTLDTPIYFSLAKLKTYAENLNDARFILNEDRLAFSQLALRSLKPAEQQKLMREQRCRFNRGNPQGETPHPIYFGKLIGLIDLIDTKFNDRRYEFLLKPVEHGLQSRFFRKYLSPVEDGSQTSGLMNHLIKLLTGRVTPRSNLTIIDLSGIPFEIIDITVAVLTRLMFDLNFWTPAKQRHPTLLVYEEAHNYIPRTERGRGFAKTAVERVAKEGRKYGVSAMVISQRPAELSETVLSQCNSFVLMRLSNPEDQRYAAKIVGDHFAGVIQMLPTLRPGEAFVLGDGVVMPMRTLVTMPDPPPQSGDMDVFRHWASEGTEHDVDETIAHWRRQDRQHLDRESDDTPPEPAQPSPPPPATPRPQLATASRSPIPAFTSRKP